jgi:site-specific recombinase XerD
MNFPHKEPRGRRAQGALRDAKAAQATCLRQAIGDFLGSREALGCTVATLRTYAYHLDRFRFWCLAHRLIDSAALAPQTAQQYLGELRARMKLVSVHQPYRVLRTFCRWLHRAGRIPTDPLADLTMRTPKTLPRVPDDESVRRLLAACDTSFEGRRNRALIALLADSGLRKEEARRLRCGDADMNTRTLHVHQGKGRKDGVGFFGEATASTLRSWLAVHPDPRAGCFVFVTRAAAQLGPTSFVRILHRLSRRAKLERPIGPHALRHYAATSILRRTGDLELVRRVLRHETLTMALRYATLTQTEVAAKFAHASPVDHLQSRGLPASRKARW